MKIVHNPSGQCLLLIWRTDFLFYTPERKRLADEWNQVRLISAPSPEPSALIHHTLDGPLPFENESFDAIYSFHVIEHLDPTANERFARDMHRLLKPGGVYRASTPDLEFFATEYLQRLREYAAHDSPEHYARYHWAVCNLIDQLAREVSGGEMLEALLRRQYTPEYVKHANGDLLGYLFPPHGEPPQREQAREPSAAIPKNPPGLLRRVARAVGRHLRDSTPERSYFEITYEKNRWLWDRVSLSRLLSQAGFRNIGTADYRTSDIPGWSRYNFDQSALGDYALEPSIYMEATK